MKLQDKWKMRDWERDIKFFESYKSHYINTNIQGIKDRAMKRMQEIRNKWPNHQKLMELPED